MMQRRGVVLGIVAVLALMLVSGVGAQDEARPDAVNVAYAGTTDTNQTLDIYLPDGVTGPLPAVLVIHGGGFRLGDSRDVRPVAAALTLQGYAVFAVNYRLSPAHTYPAHVEDVFCAVGWVLANAAAYNVDPSRLYGWGGSAGATLALMLGTVDDPARFAGDCPNPVPVDFAPAGVVAYYPATDFVNLTPGNARMIVDYLGGTREVLPDVWAEASPITWVDGTEPPTLLIHGTADRTAPFAHSETMLAAMQAVNAPVELYVLEGVDHGFMNRLRTPAGRAALTQAVRFLDDLSATP